MELNILLLVGLILFFVWRMLPTKGVSVVTTEQLKSILKEKNHQFIDVRTQAEYRSNHIQQFENIPLQTLANRSGKLKKDKAVYVICQSGMRSSSACKQLKKLGFEQVINVKGGMNAWR